MSLGQAGRLRTLNPNEAEPIDPILEALAGASGSSAIAEASDGRGRRGLGGGRAGGVKKMGSRDCDTAVVNNGIKHELSRYKQAGNEHKTQGLWGRIYANARVLEYIHADIFVRTQLQIHSCA